MRKDQVITAIDIGTDKCATLIAKIDEKNKLQIVGVSVVPSTGIRKSVIVDLESVLNTISTSLNAAERMAGFDVNSCFISISGAHIDSINSKGVVAVANPDQEISKEDVERVIEAARAVSLPQDRRIVHVIPRDFKVDSQEGIKDPIGMTGIRLESEAHIITAMTTSLKNLEKSVNDLGLQVDGFVFSGLAAANVTLSETEKELGVALIDIGAGTTSFCVYVEGALEFSGAIPIGARHVTQDIALGCRISLDNAEKIKLHLSNEAKEVIKPHPGESKEDLNKRKKKADKIDLEKLGIEGNCDELSQKIIVDGIMMPRLKEIINQVAAKIEEKELLAEIPSGIVLTGGGAETVGLIDVVKKTLRLPARIGYPKKVEGMVSDISKPAYATSIGLLEYGHNIGGGQELKTKFKFLSNFQAKGVFAKALEFIKSLLP